MSYIHHKCLLLMLLFGFLQSYGQEKKQPLLEGAFRSRTLEAFARQVESKVNCVFYIDPSLPDSFQVSLNIQQLPVTELLERVFKNSVVHYSMDAEGHIFLTKDRTIGTGYPLSVTQENLEKEGGKEAEAPADYVSAENERHLVSLENKMNEIGTKTGNVKGEKATISGYIRDANTGEPLPGAVVFTETTGVGVNADAFGHYSIRLTTGEHTVFVRYLGMKETRRSVQLYSDGKLNIDLAELVITLKGVDVTSDQGNNIRQVQMGNVKLTALNIKQIPTLFGERDILKMALSLPGVKSVGEASSGFNVRGGSSDQNLILFNDATIYNPSHLFGFFSAINADVVKEVQFYKNSIPPKYGGRLSSLLEITSRDGNMSKFAGTASVGLVTSHFTLEGPIQKGKTSFLIGGRTTYSNWILRQLPENSGYTNSAASFYDLNLNITHLFDPQNSLSITGYRSSDQFNLSRDTLYQYEDKNLSVKWHHVFNSKFSGVLISGYDYYQTGTSMNSIPVNAYKFSFDISQIYLKSDFNYNISPANRLNFGLNSIRYLLHPGSYLPDEAGSLVKKDVVQEEQAQESALYVNEELDLSNRFSVYAGVRYSLFNFLGPTQVNSYSSNLPISTVNLIDSVNYRSGQIAKTYQGPEFRISARYAFPNELSVKAGYNTLRQYIHMISNTTSMSPTDIWKLSDPNIKPQFGDQYSLGVYKNLMSHGIEASVEIYYKNIWDYLDYKSGAMLLMNHHIETEVFKTKGKAYGVEFMVKKNAGRLNGWFSYTYSRTFFKMDDPNAGETINNGQYYPANFDKPHDLSLVANYKFSHRYSISCNVIYNTGRPITMPIGKFYYNGEFRSVYSDRNAFRVPDYFRTDLSVNLDGNHKVKQPIHGFWTLGVYNCLGRKNPYSIYFITDAKGQIQGYKLSILGTSIPYLTYNIRF